MTRRGVDIMSYGLLRVPRLFTIYCQLRLPSEPRFRLLCLMEN